MKKCKKVKCLYTNTLRYNIYKKVSNVFAGGIIKAIDSCCCVWLFSYLLVNCPMFCPILF